MSINNFLVTGVMPAANEMNVPLERDIVITFQKHMDETSLHSNNIRLRVVNGALVPTTHVYNGMMRTLTISHEPLQSGVQYQLEVVGGVTGVNSILGEYLDASRQYEFTTTAAGQDPSIDATTITVEGPYASIQWVTSGIGEGERLEFKVSSFPEEGSVGVYPTNGYQEVVEPSIDVPKRLPAGEYHIHSRIMRDGVVLSYETKSFLIEEELVNTTPTPEEPVPDNGYEELRLIESYPKNGGYGVGTNTLLGLRFSEPIDKNYHYSWVLVQKMEGDMFDVSSATLELIEDARPDVLAFQLNGLQENTKYDIILSKDIKGLPGEDIQQEVDGTLIMVSGEAKTLGKDQRISFMTTVEPLYVSVEELRDELGAAAELYDDMELYRRIGYASKAAYEVASRTRRFDETLFQDGQFPFYMKEYVKYSLAYDLAVQAISSGGSTSGKSIALGDLSVRSEEGSTSMQRDILRALKDKLKPWQDMLHGVSGRGYATMRSAVYQETGNPYPDFLEGYGEYAELGE